VTHEHIGMIYFARPRHASAALQPSPQNITPSGGAHEERRTLSPAQCVPYGIETASEIGPGSRLGSIELTVETARQVWGESSSMLVEIDVEAVVQDGSNA
jgi:hypothetical protein